VALGNGDRLAAGRPRGGEQHLGLEDEAVADDLFYYTDNIQGA